VKYLAPVLTFRVILGSGGTSTLVLDNQPQAARNADGSKVFFTWIDTDTCGGLFGTSNNILPNLRGVSWRVTDGHRTAYKLFTDKDLLIGENIIYPSMAPVTLRRPSAEHMFTGFPRMLIPGDELQPCEYTTLINHTWFDDSEYQPEAMYPDLSWNCDFVVQTVAQQSSGTVLHPPYPNPSQGNATLSFELAQQGFAELQISDLQGRTIETLWEGDAPQGQQTLTVDLSDLPSGVYFCVLREPEGTHVQKWVVTH
jgi:hypothetical protein